MTVATSREYTRNSQLISTFQIYCFKDTEIVYDYALSFLVHKEFLHLKQLNEFIQMASASGLIERWHLSSRARHTSTYESGDDNTGFLTFDKVIGVIITNLINVVLSFAIFALEIIVHKKAHEPNPKRFWTFTEMLINSERYFWNENNCYWK